MPLFSRNRSSMSRSRSRERRQLGASGFQPPKETLGMFNFQTPKKALIDIVAVHGLNGHYEDTWTWVSDDKSIRQNWLKDFLPNQIPNARIMSYGYDSTVQFSKSSANVNIFADQLLNDLKSQRMDPGEKIRSIVFICHSLGGIVVKKVVILPKPLYYYEY